MKKQALDKEPKLRFKDFKREARWQPHELGDFFNERVEKGFPDKTVLSATQDKGVIPYSLLDKSVIRDNQNLIGYKLVKKGDFVISLRSFEGGFEYSDYEGIISPAYVILQRKREIHDEFFRALFKASSFITAIKNRLNNNLRDGKSISFNQAKGMTLFIPSIAEQKKIATCLSSLDDLITAEMQKLEALKTHKKGIMQQLFPSPDNIES
jgi:type I restriction enzyme, S subunit